MANELAVDKEFLIRSLARSELPSAVRKSAMQRIFEKVGGEQLTSYLEQKGIAITGDHSHALGHLARDGGEGLVVGAGLGYIDAKMGLDIGPVPVDLVTATVAGAGSVALGSYAGGHEMRNITTSCLSVFGFRKMKSVTEKKAAAEKSKMAAAGDEYESDPVLRVSKTIK